MDTPLIWGGLFGIASATLVIGATALGVQVDASPLIEDPMRAAGAGFLFGILSWNIRNWVISRHREQ